MHYRNHLIIEIQNTYDLMVRLALWAQVLEVDYRVIKVHIELRNVKPRNDCKVLAGTLIHGIDIQQNAVELNARDYETEETVTAFFQLEGPAKVELHYNPREANYGNIICRDH